MKYFFSKAGKMSRGEYRKEEEEKAKRMREEKNQVTAKFQVQM